jgi:hypothetical protein
MSTILFSKTFVGRINAIIRRFWWACIQDDNPTSLIACRSWEDIYQPKENRGLGIRDLHMVNKSLLTNAVWNIANSKNPFLTSALKAKYYHNFSFWTANTTALGLFFGLLLCRLRRNYATTQFTRSMQVTAPFGPPRGV